MIARGPSDIIETVNKARRDAQSGSALGWGPSGRRFKSGRPDFSRISRKGQGALDTLLLVLSVIGFFALIAVFFFGGFVLLDLWSRGGDAFDEAPGDRGVIPSLNDLRLVGLEDLILHESHDEDRLCACASASRTRGNSATR